MKLLKARSAEMQGLEELPGKANYFIGRDPKKWRTDVAGYAKLRCRGVYPGIDLCITAAGGSWSTTSWSRPGAIRRAFG